jgi:hypothetical protein
MTTFKVERYGVLLKTSFQVRVPTNFVIEVTPDVLPLALKRIVTVSDYNKGFVTDLQLMVSQFTNLWADASELNPSYNPHRLVKIDGPIILKGKYTGLVTEDNQYFHENGSPIYEFGILVYGSKTTEWIHR